MIEELLDRDRQVFLVSLTRRLLLLYNGFLFDCRLLGRHVWSFPLVEVVIDSVQRFSASQTTRGPRPLRTSWSCDNHQLKKRSAKLESNCSQQRWRLLSFDFDRSDSNHLLGARCVRLPIGERENPERSQKNSLETTASLINFSKFKLKCLKYTLLWIKISLDLTSFQPSTFTFSKGCGMRNVQKIFSFKNTTF